MQGPCLNTTKDLRKSIRIKPVFQPSSVLRQGCKGPGSFCLFGKKTEATAEPGAARPGAQKTELHR